MKLNETWNNIKQSLNKYFNSIFFVAVTAIVVFLAWLTGTEIIGLVFAAVSIIVICYTCDTLLPAVASLVLMVFSISGHFYADNYIIGNLFWIIPLCILLFGSLIYFIIVNTRNGKIKLTTGRQFYYIIALFVACLLGGILYNFAQWASGIPILLALGVAGIGSYLFVVNGIPKIDKKFLLAVFIAAGVIVCAELFVLYVRNIELFSASEFEFKERLNFGWGISNNAASVLLFTIPLTIYAITAYSKYGFLHVCLTLLQIVAVIFTLSRGVLMILAAGLPVIYIFTLIKTKKKIKFLLNNLMGIAFIALVCVLSLEFLIQIYERAIHMGLNDSGRSGLVDKAIEDWLINAATIINGTGSMERFGEGMGYSMYFYHCTPFQILTNAGIIGGIAYFCYSYSKFKVLIEHSDLINRFILFAVSMWTLYSFADPSSYMFNQLIILAVLLGAAEKMLLPKAQESLFSADSSSLTQSQSLPLT